jgi:tRNA-Thr(GGU) m(6)t(6)A37 methyltransferase TsaA
MNESRILYKPIGIIKSEHTSSQKTPIQPVFAEGCLGRAEIFPEYAEGLRDLEGFSHIYLIYHLHKAKDAKLLVKPFLQDTEHGVFATRSPDRPNAIGMSIVELLKLEGNILYLKGLDILNDTPLLDIKPYTSKFDQIKTTRNGWQDDIDDSTASHRGNRGYKG